MRKVPPGIQTMFGNGGLPGSDCACLTAVIVMLSLTASPSLTSPNLTVRWLSIFHYSNNPVSVTRHFPLLLLRKQKLKLEAQLPLRAIIWLGDVAEGLKLSVDWELCDLMTFQWKYLAQPEQFADATTERSGPNIAPF